MAYEDPEPLSELIFHSGYGSQYLSHRFQQFLREHHTKQPFSHLGKPYDNTVAETFFASLKKKSSTERTFLPIERLKPVLLHISSFIIPIVHWKSDTLPNGGNYIVNTKRDIPVPIAWFLRFLHRFDALWFLCLLQMSASCIPQTLSYQGFQGIKQPHPIYKSHRLVWIE